jgi:hypothetical protein
MSAVASHASLKTSVFMTINKVTTELNFDGSIGKAIPAGRVIGTDRKSCIFPLMAAHLPRLKG